MRRYPHLPRRFRLPWRDPAQIEADVAEEIAFHLEMRVSELVARGVRPADARAQAEREFGEVEAAGASLRAADRAMEARRRRTEWLQGFQLDVRVALRSLRRTWPATLTAVLTLGLGIGAVTAVFSLINWVLLRPVPGVADPDRLVIVQMRENGDQNETGLSYPNLVDLQQGVPALEGLAGYSTIGLQVALGDTPPSSLLGQAVAGDYFGTLGLRAFAGRFFGPEEQRSTDPIHLAVISHRLWHSRLNADPAVIGRPVRLNGLDFTVIGVTPEGFSGTERLGRVDVWVPASAYGSLRHQNNLSIAERKASILQQMVGRLAPAATSEVAQEQLRGRMERLVEGHPEINEIYSVYVPTVFEGIGTSVRSREHVGRTLSLMLAIVSVLLLIAAANVGNLLLLRGVRRRGETAVRRALGASVFRLLRTHLLEGVLLAFAGGGVGLLLALMTMRLVRAGLISGLYEVDSLHLDWRVLAFVFALCLLSGAIFGVIPILAAQRESFLDHLKEASRTSTGRFNWIRNGLIVAQVASAMVLLVAALFLTRTLHSLNRVDLGFDAEGVSTFDMDPTDLGYDPERNRSFRENLRARLASTPGIETFALSSGSPFSSAMVRFRLHDPGAPEEAFVEAAEYSVTSGYFATLGIPLLAGRGPGSAGAESDVVISQTLARRLFGDANPLGRQVLGPRFGGSTAASYTVVGIAGDTRVQDLRGAGPDPVLYRPFSALEGWRSGTVLLVRSPLPRAEVEARVREAVSAIEPSLAIWHTATMPESVASTIREERVLAQMTALLAALAGALAAVGLYTVISYSVAQRTREIGIRVALGARLGAIVRLVGREAAGVVGVGIVLGMAVALGGSRLLESRLFGVERLDPSIYGAAAGLFALAAMIALWSPLREAAAVDPAEPLRQE